MCLTLVEFGGRILFLIYYLMIIGLNKSFITDHLLIALLHFKQKVGTIGCSSISLGIHPSPLLSSSLSFCSPLLSIVKYLNPPLRHDALCPFRRFVIPIDFNLNVLIFRFFPLFLQIDLEDVRIALRTCTWPRLILLKYANLGNSGIIAEAGATHTHTLSHTPPTCAGP